jgi:hypothetical protein
MPAVAQKSCDAAAAVQARLRRRGAEIRGLVRKGTLTREETNALASSLGRALHTIQDNCAHEGMSNPQHAWYSNRGWCLSSGEDPDEHEAAIQCARDETWAVLQAVVKTARDAGVRLSDLRADRVSTWNPSREQVCTFLREWEDFDGRDRRWDNRVTVPAFRKTLISKLSTGADERDVCASRPSIATPSPRAPVAVSDPLCFTTRLYCIGH